MSSTQLKHSCGDQRSSSSSEVVAKVENGRTQSKFRGLVEEGKDVLRARDIARFEQAKQQPCCVERRSASNPCLPKSHSSPKEDLPGQPEVCANLLEQNVRRDLGNDDADEL